MKQIERVWTDRSPGEGVLVKRSKGHYAYAPPELILDGSNLYDAVAQLNVKVNFNQSKTSFVRN